MSILAGSAERFAYDRDAQAVGIVHLGIGAFHRAHQAWYTDLALDRGDCDWAITGVSLRSGDVADQMNPQNGLFTVTERDGAGERNRVIGSIRNVLVAPRQREDVFAALAAPGTRIVSLTVTEKGYARKADGRLDFDLAAGGFYPLVAEALERRRNAGQPGLTLMSCDNLAANGLQLQQLMTEYLAQERPELLQWFEDACTCPSTMVDRIVPATTADDRAALAARIGVSDEAAVFTEPFTQWVVEDRFAAGRPRWDVVGAQMVADVAPYESAKLRLLNGAHSALAYLGLRRGHTFVHEAIGDPAIRPLVEELMRREAAPTVAAAPGQDLSGYADSLLLRFANSALNHRLAQIAMDGSQKIPQRWLETLAAASVEGRRCPAILTALGAWLSHVRGDNGPVDDPLAGTLARLWSEAGMSGIVGAVFGRSGVLASEWTPDAYDCGEIERSIAAKSLTHPGSLSPHLTSLNQASDK
ncbi:fructuronate reductase [Novosphingobium chloroacetimidivorans]|uniref:Fructuronate reductase n=1 Tax=Novosphingobium chloroacetimidivorans TaxID=1428314 RepID=A0A7W7NX72_9SPHN|nr:mannitol dehydrogenase family protein [Novosphingobium chloroacetimidivorans]MBB4858890.1 fructuronate reductase [Novosphingobium chloroacetimidivorans]